MVGGGQIAEEGEEYEGKRSRRRGDGLKRKRKGSGKTRERENITEV